MISFSFWNPTTPDLYWVSPESQMTEHIPAWVLSGGGGRWQASLGWRGWPCGFQSDAPTGEHHLPHSLPHVLWEFTLWNCPLFSIRLGPPCPSWVIYVPLPFPCLGAFILQIKKIFWKLFWVRLELYSTCMQDELVFWLDSLLYVITESLWFPPVFLWMHRIFSFLLSGVCCHTNHNEALIALGMTADSGS